MHHTAFRRPYSIEKATGFGHGAVLTHIQRGNG
nr:MAG TPA: hypothetical protein [Caudoviricetes sp.]